MNFTEYRDHNGKNWVLPSVKIAEQEIHNEEPIVPDYIFPNSKLFTKLATELLLGENSSALKEERVSLEYMVDKIIYISVSANKYYSCITYLQYLSFKFQQIIISLTKLNVYLSIRSQVRA